MGTDKALLVLDGETFLERVVKALTEGGCDPVLVVVSPDRPGVRAEATRLRTTVIENPHPGEGPITSLRLALSHLSEAGPDAVVWLPLDFPLVASAHVARLRETAAESAAPLVLFSHRGKRGHPVLFDRSLFAELADPSLEGGARIVVHRHLEKAAVISVDDVSVVTDVDTPDAYERLTSTRGAM